MPVDDLMRAQGGAVHHRQARALGMSERRIATRLRTGAWHEAQRQVYVPAGAPPSFAMRCAAAVVAVRYCGLRTERRPVAVARLAAAFLLGLDVPEPSTVHVLVPFEDAVGSLSGARVVRTSAWTRRAFTVVDGLPVTSIQDTLVDIALRVPRERLHALVQEAAFGRPGLTDAILRCCRRGRAGSTNARRAAALVAAGVDSSLHARGLALLRAAGLNAVECGVVLARGAGPSDCVVRTGSEAPPFGLVVEWDGDAHRVDRQTFLHDREKDRLLRRAGYVTLRYTDAQVRRRDLVVADLRAEWAAALTRSVEPVRPITA